MRKVVFMELLSNNPDRDGKITSSRDLPVTEIPRRIREQEAEIEAIFRHLVRLGRRPALHHSQYRTDGRREQEIASWILIAVLGFVSVVGLYLLSAQD